MKWFVVIVSLGCLLPASLLVTNHVAEVDERIAELETRSEAERAFLHRHRAELESVQAELRSIGEAMEGGTTQELAGRLESAERRLVDLNATVTNHDSRLGYLDEAREQFGPAVLEARLQLYDRSQAEQLEDLKQMAQDAAVLAEGSLARLEALSGEVDPVSLWGELVGPVVQLSGDTSVGSGVLVESRPRGGAEGGYVTYLLTAWHVVRDIQGDLSNREMPVPVTMYDADGPPRLETASLIDFDATLDVALLTLDTDERVEFGTQLADPDLLESVRTFHGVIAVGCPLGNDPIPTRGEVSSPRHDVDGETYWMINAPTYIGNSGGAIFDAETHSLLGIFSKIYTHGSLRPTVVPHMGLVTPLGSVYPWLERIGYGELIPGEAGELPSVALHGQD